MAVIALSILLGLTCGYLFFDKYCDKSGEKPLDK